MHAGKTIWIADAHRDDGKRFVVRADEKLTAFVELEAAIRGCGFSSGSVRNQKRVTHASTKPTRPMTNTMLHSSGERPDIQRAIPIAIKTSPHQWMFFIVPSLS